MTQGRVIARDLLLPYPRSRDSGFGFEFVVERESIESAGGTSDRYSDLVAWIMITLA